MLKQKLTDKFSNIFNRDKKQKQQRPQEPKRQQPVYFNESYFECKLVYNPHKLALIKVIANILVGPDAGTPMMVACKWFVKKNGQYSEIQGVTSSCYQPCIEDVACSVLVQITPLIQGKTYSGATITKETGPLELGSALETLFTETKTKLYYQKEEIDFNMKIQAVFGKECSYSALEYPQDGKFIIKKQQDNNFQIEIVTTEFKTYFWITKQFPTLEFIRKSYNSVVISFTEYQSMRLAFKEGTDREILALLLRTLTANSTLDWPIKDEEEKQGQGYGSTNDHEDKISIQLENGNHESQLFEKQPKVQENFELPQEKKLEAVEESSISKSQEIYSTPSKSQLQVSSLNDLSAKSTSQKEEPNNYGSNSLMQLEMRVGDLNTELNKIKKEHKDLLKNYNLEKQSKCRLEHQLKKVNDRLVDFQKVLRQKAELTAINEKANEDNRFYRNQISLLNKNLKKRQVQLQAALKGKEQLQTKIKKYETKGQGSKPTVHYEDAIKNEAENWRRINNQLSEQNQQLKAMIQKLQNSLTTANRKLQSLHQQKSITTSEYPKSDTLIPASSSLSSELAQKDRIISNLTFKITNLQMLVRHKSGERGGQTLSLHKIINNLTEAITEKEEQLQQAKKINKQLIQKYSGSGS